MNIIPQNTHNNALGVNKAEAGVRLENAVGVSIYGRNVFCQRRKYAKSAYKNRRKPPQTREPIAMRFKVFNSFFKPTTVFTGYFTLQLISPAYKRLFQAFQLLSGN
ncbi:MAG TPA: hypothetical protein VJI71_02090 [Candidatus Norongarragalinales archaeon]|nr:hypothetical protein [Candidatus Norongarragalinales archaeon]